MMAAVDPQGAGLACAARHDELPPVGRSQSARDGGYGFVLTVPRFRGWPPERLVKMREVGRVVQQRVVEVGQPEENNRLLLGFADSHGIRADAVGRRNQQATMDQ
jgi:hypothetical protein